MGGIQRADLRGWFVLRRLGATGILLAIVLAFGWLPPLNDAVYPPPEALDVPGVVDREQASCLSGVDASQAGKSVRCPPPVGSNPTVEPSSSPAAPVARTAEPIPTPGTFTGIASWYRYRPGEAAAGPALRVGDWRGSVVTVCGRVCATVTLTDWCQCYGTRVIDLDSGAFEAVCGALTLGLCRVTVEW